MGCCGRVVCISGGITQYQKWGRSMSKKIDAGINAVKAIRDLLQIDDEWAVDTKRGFTWWSYRLAQHVVADPPQKWEDGMETSAVRIWTEILRDIDLTQENIDAVQALNIEETMSALVIDPKTRTLNACCTVLFHNENAPELTPITSMAAIIQNCEAHAIAQTLAGVFGGSTAESQHPKSGERPESDEMLLIEQNLGLGIPEAATTFAGDLIGVVPEFAMSHGLFAMGGDDACTLEVPYTSSQPSMMSMLDGSPVGSALAQMGTDEDHPRIGSGVLFRLALPRPFDSPEVAASAANDLNHHFATVESGATFLGAWCVDPTSNGASIIYTSFYPDVLARPGILQNAAFQLARLSQVSQEFFGDEWTG